MLVMSYEMRLRNSKGKLVRIMFSYSKGSTRNNGLSTSIRDSTQIIFVLQNVTKHLLGVKVTKYSVVRTKELEL